MRKYGPDNVDFTPTQPNVDGIISAAIRVVRLEDWSARFMATPPGVGDGTKAKALEANWLRIVRARRDLRNAVRGLKTR